MLRSHTAFCVQRGSREWGGAGSTRLPRKYLPFPRRWYGCDWCTLCGLRTNCWWRAARPPRSRAPSAFGGRILVGPPTFCWRPQTRFVSTIFGKITLPLTHTLFLSRLACLKRFLLPLASCWSSLPLRYAEKIPVAGGRYHPTSVMFAEKGSIYVSSSKEELAGPAAAARKKIGSFSVDLPTLPPMVDRNFAL